MLGGGVIECLLSIGILHCRLLTVSEKVYVSIIRKGNAQKQSCQKPPHIIRFDISLFY